MKQITIFRPDQPATFQVGKELVSGKKGTGIYVNRIFTIGKHVIILLSNKERIRFYNMPWLS